MRFRRGFSLIELVIVVVIIGVITAIAIPRMSSARERAQAAAVSDGVAKIDTAIQLYKAEHLGRNPCQDVDGSISYDSTLLRDRLIGRSTSSGAVAADAPFGPYLQAIPKNPFSACDWLRADDLSSPRGCSWVFDPTNELVRPDHTPNLWHDGQVH